MPKQTFFNLPDEKRERIIQCAVAEFAQKGYRQASISQMVQEAGIAKGSFYQYFEDKDDLFLHIVVTQLGSIKLGAFERESAHLTEMNVSEFFRHVGKVQLKEFRAHPELVKISLDLVRMPPDEPIYQKLIQSFGSSANTRFLPILQHKIEQGDIDRQVNALLLNFMLMGIGQYLTFLFNSGAVSDLLSEELIDKVAEDLDFILTNGIYTEKGKRS